MKNGGHTKNELNLGEIAEGKGESIRVLRRSTRIPYYKKLKYGLLGGRGMDEGDNLKFTGFTFNLSEHGIGLEGSKGFPPNFRIRAALFTGEDTLKFEGTIRWLYHTHSEKWFMGIEITSHPDELKKIYSLLFRTRGAGL
ncbi:MAG: hypothetical protein KJ002_00245 [Candidatus Dadabacteria bacterium]|nr:hypothetical protein [Candidatus Dadabacteria bacterium]